MLNESGCNIQQNYNITTLEKKHEEKLQIMVQNVGSSYQHQKVFLKSNELQVFDAIPIVPDADSKLVYSVKQSKKRALNIAARCCCSRPNF